MLRRPRIFFVVVLLSLPALVRAQSGVPVPVPSPSAVPTPSPAAKATAAPTPRPTPVPTPTPVPAPSSSEEAAVRATSGTGMYVWQWKETGSVRDVVAKAKASGIHHLIVRASDATDGFYLRDTLAELLPAAHAEGIMVVAYDPPRFEDVEADAQRARELIEFRARGHGIDAFAADIEPKWHLLTEDAARRYGARVRALAGPEFPLVAVVFPPNMVGDRVPYAAIAESFDVLSPMSYWRAVTTDGPGFVADSVRQLAAYGRPVTAIGQTFSYDGLRRVELRGHPPQAEFEAAVRAAKGAGAIGMSFWVWQHAEPWVFGSLAAIGWQRAPGPGIGSDPPVVATPTPDPTPTPSPAPVEQTDPAEVEAARLRAFGPVEPVSSGPMRAQASAFVLAALALLCVRGPRPDPQRVRAVLASGVRAAERGAAPLLGSATDRSR